MAGLVRGGRRGLATTSKKAASYSVQDEEDFKTRVLASQVPVVVDFSAQWCGPCKLLTPRLDAAIAAQEGAVDLAVVDIDDLAELAMEHNVNAVPTVLGMKEGKVIDRFVGLLEEDKLAAFIDNLKEA
jgi:thioredoxin 1